MALTKITPDVIESTIQQSGFKNKIIGGDFSTNPWQRGTGFATVADGVYTADRWQYRKSTDTGVVSISKVAYAPTANQTNIFTQHCLYVDVTTADPNISSTEYSYIEQKIEGFNSMPLGFGQPGSRFVTLSFWHNHTITGTYSVSLSNSALTRSYVASYNQSASNTWEKSVITIPVDTSGTWLYDNGVGLRVRFCIASGTTYQTGTNAWVVGDFLAAASQINVLDSTNNNFGIALVQLEAGSKASDYDARGVGQEIRLCQRYFEKSYDTSIAPGTVTTEGAVGIYTPAIGPGGCKISVQFKIQKRAVPTMSYYSTASSTPGSWRDMSGADRQTASDLIGTSGFTVTNNVSVNAAAQYVHFTASAEL